MSKRVDTPTCPHCGGELPRTGQLMEILAAYMARDLVMKGNPWADDPFPDMTVKLLRDSVSEEELKKRFGD